MNLRSVGGRSENAARFRERFGAAARLAGDQANTVATPSGWKYAGSLSEKLGFVPKATAEQATRFLRHENGLDVFLDLVTGREVYVGRTSKK